MNLSDLKDLLLKNGCHTLYVKKLAPNDNSKNQIYFGGSFDILNILPITDIKAVEAGEWKRERFKAAIKFSWISEDGSLYPAPNARLILYPKYPEVRFSGFLKGTKKAPSELMTQRLTGRLLLFSIDRNGTVLGYVAPPGSVIANELKYEELHQECGVFKVIGLAVSQDSRDILIQKLKKIHDKGWIDSKRLSSDGGVLPCVAPNCGGYTLEAELNIRPNGYSEPDFMGWEVKQYNVRNFDKIYSSVITLMTPEPTSGVYKEKGAEYFIRRYGYADKHGRPERMNFGGIHRTGKRHPLTKLEMRLIGFDKNSGKIRNSNGKIVLLDEQENEAASWNFSSLMLHWNRKHNKACYVPSMLNKTAGRKYRFGNKILLGTGTDFQLFLFQMAIGNIYYDPGIKLENMGTKPRIKKRSQFRITSRFLDGLYKESKIVNFSD